MGELTVHITIIGLWLYAVVQDAMNDNYGWLLVDLLSPLGPFRGFYLLFFA